MNSTQHSDQAYTPHLGRRNFLTAAGALVVSASGVATVTQVMAQATTGTAGAAIAAVPTKISTTKPQLLPTELDSWVAIQPNGGVVAYFGKVDLGQGLEVAIGQIVAEELDVEYSKVQVIMGDTASSVNQGGASSALGVQAGAKPLRNAAAEARRILVELAATQLNVPIANLVVKNGVISTSGEDAQNRQLPLQTLSYSDLVGGKFFNSKVEWNKKEGNALDIAVRAKVKSPSTYKVVGQPIMRKDVAWKVFGNGGNIGDVRVPGMLHARVIRSSMAGAVPQSVDIKSIAHIVGAKVVQEKNFLAVVAEKEWDAVRGARELQVKWSESKKPFPEYAKLHDHIRKSNIVKREVVVKVGQVDVVLKAASRVIEAEYVWPFQSHASMGPASAIADVKPGGVTIWTGSQKPHFAQVGVANLLKIPVEKVRAIWVVGPGSYGRNDAGDAVMDAAMLSKLTARPVRVQYMRHDATGWDPKAPASVHRVRASLDANGMINAYEFISKGFSRASIESNESDPRDSLVGLDMGMVPKAGVGFGVPDENYVFANKTTGWEVIPDLIDGPSPLRTSHLRDPVGLQIHFASEQFIDELAFIAKEDPIAFRIKHLKTPRDIAVLKAAAQRSGWQPRGNAVRDLNREVLTGRGLSYATRGGTILAIVAEIEVNKKTGHIWGRKFTVSHDCGLIINPQTLRMTIENAVVQSLSRSLFEEVQFAPDKVISTDWATYPILNLPDAPESIDVVLLNNPELPSTGAGEASCRLVPAAIANAFFDATGVRLREAPMTSDRVLAALAKA